MLSSNAFPSPKLLRTSENKYGEKPKEIIMVPYRDPKKDEERLAMGPEAFY